MAKLSDKRNNRVFLSLGTNQGDRENNLKLACSYLENVVGSINLVSYVYESEPWGNKELLPFYNLVLEIFTEFEPDVLLSKTQEIEVKIGRAKKTKINYENRIIDIDILWFNNEEFFKKDLVIPHRELRNRRFVLEPFNEIANELMVGKKNESISSLLLNCMDKSNVLKLRLLNW